MKRILSAIFIFVLGAGSVYLLLNFFPKETQAPPFINQIKPRPLDKYTIENLSYSDIPMSQIEIAETVKDEVGFSSLTFSFNLDPALTGKEKKKVTGLLNIPKGEGPFPLVVMFRGYVDQEIYKTGDGTKRAGEYFASNGYITIAPDFLGYGGSDAEAGSIFESRFQTYTTALTLLKSLDSIDKWDKKNTLIWGHSNGGQIALTVLEVTQQPYPTVLWAPVSKPFPYSILYYTDESEDIGKLIRRELAKFEELYDPDLYAIDLNYHKIKAPIELHQGTNDDAVPAIWSEELANSLLNLKLDLNYYVYQKADHNLNLSWDVVVARNIVFFHKHLTNTF
ncbi:hypothetical protein A2V56_02940 [Candidatus Woesebacteria bacterium RBG_19FT_COMBO_42_9]|nr:MAG: hypothetical protein A2V56_02940 [Candidatus Woesebacteria bacterium RBG_19FT_COMBO_42_9]